MPMQTTACHPQYAAPQEQRRKRMALDSCNGAAAGQGCEIKKSRCCWGGGGGGGGWGKFTRCKKGN
jgi:hypothetical protein